MTSLSLSLSPNEASFLKIHWATSTPIKTSGNVTRHFKPNPMMNRFLKTLLKVHRVTCHIKVQYTLFLLGSIIFYV